MMKKFVVVIILIIALAMGACYFLLNRAPNVEIKSFGVTYSKIYAEELSLDWRETYRAIFNDLGIFLVRIPVYWQEVELEQGVFDFDSIDWMLEVAKEHDAKVILAIGGKLPRWPECHEPSWVQSQSSNLKSQNLLRYIKTTIKRYDSNSTVWAWQIENEPFLNFGVCPESDAKFLDKEISMVRSLSEKPIIITDSGEFGVWFRVYKRADIFGTTLYRTVWNKFVGQFTYPLPPAFFRLKRALVEIFYKRKPCIVIELQAEPWVEKSIQESLLKEQYKSMNPKKLDELMEYIKGTGFDTFYFWGVEWWYWLKEQGEPEMWDAVKTEINDLRSR